MLLYGRFILVLVVKIVVYIKVMMVVKHGPLVKMDCLQDLMLEELDCQFPLQIPKKHMH